MSLGIILYQAVNAVNGKRYIGISKVGLKEREKAHRSEAKMGRNRHFLNALRKHGDNIEFSVLAVCPDWQYAQEMEIRAIAVFRPEYNMTKGGDGILGYRHTEESRRRISQARMGNTHTLGKRHSPESIAKMSAAKKAYYSDPNNPRKTGPRPNYVAVNARKVVCIDTGEVFPSGAAAARAKNVDSSVLLKVCRGKWVATKGLRFSYVDT